MLEILPKINHPNIRGL